jgi:hypothetical protein
VRKPPLPQNRLTNKKTLAFGARSNQLPLILGAEWIYRDIATFQTFFPLSSNWLTISRQYRQVGVSGNLLVMQERRDTYFIGRMSLL